jgi:hypothetical protein
MTAFLCVEAGVRTLGMVDFPIYEADAKIGYVPAANQKGSFLNKNEWEFNSLHMGATEFRPDGHPNYLLVGDSVVLGGNSFGRPDRLGPALQDRMQARQKAQIWPISAGSWGLRNELIWLVQHDEVVQRVDQVVIVVNSGDFGDASAWSCDLTHPLSRPISALWYLFNKYVYAFAKCGDTPAALKVPVGDLSAELKAFLSKYGSKTSFMLYPNREESLDRNLESMRLDNDETILRKAGATSVVRIARDSRWSSRWYKDEIHPTAEGNRVLAEIINDTLELR